MWCIQTMEYYTTFIRKEVLIHAIMWMNSESITQIEYLFSILFGV